MNLSLEQQYAIEAKLNLILGPAVYDAVFPGIQITALDKGTLNVIATNEWAAGVIEKRYSYEIAFAAEQVLNEPIAFVSVLPRELRMNMN